MPEISRILRDRDPHVLRRPTPAAFSRVYGSAQAVVGLADLAVLKGELPPRALGLVMKWAVQHRQELTENWESARAMKPLKSIAPLE